MVIDIGLAVENEPQQASIGKLRKLTMHCVFQHKAKIGNLGKFRF